MQIKKAPYAHAPGRCMEMRIDNHTLLLLVVIVK